MLLSKPYAHEFVARDLRGDARRCDAGDLSIALDNAKLCLVDVHGIAVDEHGGDIVTVATGGKIAFARRERANHRDAQGCGHAAGVNLLGLDACNAHAKGQLVDLRGKLLAPLGRELLRIIEPHDLRLIGKGHAGNDKGTGQRSPAHLVNAGDDAFGRKLAHIRIELRGMYPAELFAFLFGEAD